MEYTRQEGLFNPKEFTGRRVSIIGVGSVGSFVAIGLAKMGITNLIVWDDDTVEEHNLPNQFYRIDDLRVSKVSALQNIIYEFTDGHIETNEAKYQGEKLQSDIVISAVDSMGTRKFIWDNVKNDVGYYIDTRMGGNLMRIYTVNPLNKKNVKFYEKSLKVTDSLEQLKCTERTILYNVLTISGIVGSLVVKILKKEPVPSEIIFDMKTYQFIVT